MKTIPLPMLGSKSVTIIKPRRASSGTRSWNREWFVKGPNGVLAVVGTAPYFYVMTTTEVRRSGIVLGYKPANVIEKFSTLENALDYASEKVQ